MIRVEAGTVSTALTLLIGNIFAIAVIAFASLVGFMWLAPAIVAAVVICIWGLTRPLEFGVGLMIVGPVLLSTIRISSLTGDNIAVLLGCCYLLFWITRTRGVRFSALMVLPCTIALAVVISGLVNDVPFLQVGVRFSSLILLTLCAPFVRRGVLMRIIRIVLLVGIFSIFLQTATRFIQPFYDADGSVRYGGLMGHPNFGSYLIGSYIIYIMVGKRLSKVDISICVLGLIAMLLAASQTALLVLAAIGVLILLRQPVRLLIAGGLVASAVAILGSTFLDRVLPFLESGSLASSSSGSWRLSQWQSALNLVEFPNLFGIGWQQTKVQIGDGLGAHSGYVTAYVELGLVGCVFVAFGLFFVFVATKRSTGALFLWLYILICSVTDPVVFYPSCIALALLISIVDWNGRPAIVDEACGRSQMVKI
ncbi:O-antigen ligase family protein [Rhodococcus sp. IEGM 1341]|uniref:O-antigen ligase family protein n=1 Tax=Rhodococcus sp. IEGM 1341 TaxID=3047090 RepID=UPI0024B7B656|nr:O-antigen ligase family protein [Rhodococcus sp. IEGM 1341]MDI9926236.1 O-antigen ligase family protein [Rhodococcus sp. IEGM 1341]